MRTVEKRNKMKSTVISFNILYYSEAEADTGK